MIMVCKDHIIGGRFFSMSLAALVFMSLLSLPACSKRKQPPVRVVPIVAAAVMQKDVPLQLRAIGTVEAFSTVAVKSQVSGEIAEVFFREGQDVKKGAQLFLIDPRPFEAAVRQAESVLDRDRAQLANAREEAKRYSILAEKGYVSRQEYDRMQTAANALEAVVRADEAAVENARLQLGYTRIVSPIDGRTGTILMKAGNVVKANDLPLVTINQISPINVSFSVPEQELAAVKKHHAAGELKVQAVRSGNTQQFSYGKLAFIDNAVNTATGTIMLKATFPNVDRALWPGQFVDVVLTLAVERNRIVVPSEAVQTGQQGQYVFIVKEDMSAELRPVSAGRTFNGMTVIEKGLKPGETVVTDGQIRLVPGAKVEIKKAEEKQKPRAESTSSKNK